MSADVTHVQRMLSCIARQLRLQEALRQNIWLSNAVFLLQIPAVAGCDASVEACLLLLHDCDLAERDPGNFSSQQDAEHAAATPRVLPFSIG